MLEAMQKAGGKIVDNVDAVILEELVKAVGGTTEK